MIHKWIGFASLALDCLAVALMFSFIRVGSLLALIRYLNDDDDVYSRYRIALARTLQVGLELLVAADIIRTVSAPLTALNLALLSGLIVVRTFLGWTLSVEVKGRWPWQEEKPVAAGSSKITK